MAKLDLQDYCQDCPRFEAKISKGHNFLMKSEPIFTIRCEYSSLCRNINKYLAEKMAEKEVEKVEEKTR